MASSPGIPGNWYPRHRATYWCWGGGGHRKSAASSEPRRPVSWDQFSAKIPSEEAIQLLYFPSMEKSAGLTLSCTLLKPLWVQRVSPSNAECKAIAPRPHRGEQGIAQVGEIFAAPSAYITYAVASIWMGCRWVSRWIASAVAQACAAANAWVGLWQFGDTCRKAPLGRIPIPRRGSVGGTLIMSLPRQRNMQEQLTTSAGSRRA